MSPLLTIVYLGVLAAFGVIILAALWVGWPWPTIVAAAVIAGLFAFSAPFVLGGRWRRRPPAPAPRPKRRRR